MFEERVGAIDESQSFQNRTHLSIKNAVDAGRAARGIASIGSEWTNLLRLHIHVLIY